MSEAKPPKGTVAILTAPNGDVVASISDFCRDGFGGYTLSEAQDHRAKRNLHRTAIRAFCNWDVADVIDEYTAERIVNALVRDKKYRVSIIHVGDETA